MVTKINERIQECFNKGNIDKKNEGLSGGVGEFTAEEILLITEDTQKGVSGGTCRVWVWHTNRKISESVDHKLRPLLT